MRESGPGTFQLCIPRIARLVSSSVGADSSGTESPVVGAPGCYCTSSMMAGFIRRVKQCSYKLTASCSSNNGETCCVWDARLSMLGCHLV